MRRDLNRPLMRRNIVIAVIALVAITLAVLRFYPWPQSTPPVQASAPPVSQVMSPSPAASAATPAASESASPSGSASPSDSSSPTQSATPVESPTASPTPATPPPGLPPGWEKQSDRVENGPEADLVVRTGSIDNLGFGWPTGFNPFSGQSTPAHPWPCDGRPGAAPGTDHIMLGSSVPVDSEGKATSPLEGYSGCAKRPDDLPQAIPLDMGTLPSTIHRVELQVFVDDFQPVPMHSNFQVSLNGTRIPSWENTVNQLDQTGPIGKLLTLELLPEYWPILKSGTVNLLFDDPTTGKADGYAIDFARFLINPKKLQFAVTIACNVVDAATQKPIAHATVSAGGVTATTDASGNCELRDVPAGLVSVSAAAVNYDSATQLLDLPAGEHGTANFQLKRHAENVTDLKKQIEKSGTVAIYGIHFDTASANLRPDSLASLKQILELIDSSPGSRWIIAGHTDNQGGGEYNMNLSLARAASVVKWLTDHGVAANRLTAKGYGLTRPVADNSTENGRALNRRVEVSIVK